MTDSSSDIDMGDVAGQLMMAKMDAYMILMGTIMGHKASFKEHKNF